MAFHEMYKRRRTSALHRAAVDGDTENVRKLLMQESVDVEAVNKWGRRPLHCAAVGGHSEAALLLLKKDADVDAIDKDDMTPWSSLSPAGKRRVRRRHGLRGQYPAALGGHKRSS